MTQEGYFCDETMNILYLEAIKAAHESYKNDELIDLKD